MWPDLILHQEKGVWDTAIEQFAACTVECIPVTVHTSNSAVHMLPEGCDYKEKIPNLSVSGE